MSFDVELHWAIVTTAFLFQHYPSVPNSVAASRIGYNWDIVVLWTVSVLSQLQDDLVGGLIDACTISLNQAAAVKMAYICFFF